MAKLADLPGGGVTWAQVVAYVETMRDRGVFRAEDAQMLPLYQQRAADEAAASRKVR
jgi:hypothetical protein